MARGRALPSNPAKANGGTTGGAWGGPHLCPASHAGCVQCLYYLTTVQYPRDPLTKPPVDYNSIWKTSTTTVHARGNPSRKQSTHPSVEVLCWLVLVLRAEDIARHGSPSQLRRRKGSDATQHQLDCSGLARAWRVFHGQSLCCCFFCLAKEIEWVLAARRTRRERGRGDGIGLL